MMLLTISCGNNMNFLNDGLVGNGNVVSTKRNTESYNAIEAKTGINVLIEQSDNYAIEAKTDENLQEHLKLKSTTEHYPYFSTKTSILQKKEQYM